MAQICNCLSMKLAKLGAARPSGPFTELVVSPLPDLLVFLRRNPCNLVRN